MNTDEILSNAHEVKPELVDKAAASLQLLEKMGSPYAEDLREEFQHILSFTQEKVAGAKEQAGLKVLKTVGVGIGATLGGMLATSVATDLYDAAKRGLSRGVNFRRILAANPELAKAHDMGTLKSSFNTIHRYAPEFTADPLFGGSLLHNMAAMVEDKRIGIDPRPIKDIIDSRKNLQEAKHKQFGTNAFKIESSKKDGKGKGQDKTVQALVNALAAKKG